jgi:hypothetical protein
VTHARYIITATLEEDAHLGIGSGGNGVDSLVARDRFERPVIWSSHFKGVLRDAAHRSVGTDFAERFFGRGGGQRRQITIGSLYTQTDVQTRVWRSAARKAFDNRAPMDETLRAIEFIPANTSFSGLVETDRPDELRTLLNEANALGRGRAAGAGRVRYDLQPAHLPQRKFSSTNTSGSTRLRLLLRNEDPLCISATATPTNLIPSLPFVPGRVLKGSIAAWLANDGQTDAAQLVISEKIRVGDALPLPERPEHLREVEVLPAPLTLRRAKPEGSPGPIPWWAGPHLGPRRVDGTLETDEALKRPEPDLFVCRFSPGERWRAYRPDLRIRLRGGRPRRALELFATEQIAEKTWFAADIEAEADQLERLSSALAPVLSGSRWLLVGRGGAPVEVADTASGSEPAGSGGKYLILTSDMLVRDERLRWVTELTSSTPVPGWPVDVTLKSKAQETSSVFGFNGTSGLWRQPAAAIRRGSVFLVAGPGIQALADAAAAGRWLGERTHEGFGRFRLDSELPGVTQGETSEPPLPSKPDLPDDVVAARTGDWLQRHPQLAERERSNPPRPSLSQWRDLVADLERNGQSALDSRLASQTEGAMTWRHKQATGILNELRAISSPRERVEHAAFFVRWLAARTKENAL